MRLCPWSLALASKFFCVLGFGLGLEPCVLDTTSAKSIRSGSFLQKRILPPRHQCKSSTQSNIASDSAIGLKALASDSAIGLDSLQNLAGAQHYDDSRFSILAQDRFPFHLSAIEATFITNSNPDLSRQKEFEHSLKISV